LLSTIAKQWTTTYAIDESIDHNMCSSNNTSLSSNHYYDTFQYKQQQKHEKCGIHGIELKMVCTYY